MIDNKIRLNYTEYIDNIALDKNIDKLLPSKLENLSNIILYGSSGCGKYTKSLNIISKYSKSGLKYTKKILISNIKNEVYIKISDIHFEIDMELLGCNSRIIWNDIYYNIINIISTNNENRGIILCKNFHTINSELLELFYSYMQNDIFSIHTIKFILISEAIAFIPTSIYSMCKIISCQKFSDSYYKKKFRENSYNNYSNINNLKTLKNINIDINNIEIITEPYIKNCNKIIDIILDDSNDINYSVLRNNLYELLIYNLNIHDCIFYIIKTLIITKKIKNIESINESLLENIFIFFKYYNNNYRPIYHLENFILYLIKLLNEL